MRDCGEISQNSRATDAQPTLVAGASAMGPFSAGNEDKVTLVTTVWEGHCSNQ